MSFIHTNRPGWHVPPFRAVFLGHKGRDGEISSRRERRRAGIERTARGGENRVPGSFRQRLRPQETGGKLPDRREEGRRIGRTGLVRLRGVGGENGAQPLPDRRGGLGEGGADGHSLHPCGVGSLPSGIAEQGEQNCKPQAQEARGRSCGRQAEMPPGRSCRCLENDPRPRFRRILSHIRHASARAARPAHSAGRSFSGT